MVKPNENTLGGRIRKARIEKKIKIKELAEILQINPNYLSTIELGKKLPSQTLLSRIAEEIGVPEDLLLKEPEDELKEKISAPSPRHTVASVDLKLLIPILISNLQCDKQLIAQFMGIETADVDNILSGGDFRFDHTWDNALSALTKRMDLDTLLEELDTLTEFLYEKREEKNDWKLLDNLEQYINRDSNEKYRLKGKTPYVDDYPLSLIESSPMYSFPQWISFESKTAGELAFLYYDPKAYCPVDEQDIEAILRSQGELDGTKLSIISGDIDLYNKFCCCYQTLYDAAASDVASIVSIIHVDMATMSILDVYTPDDLSQ